MWQKEFAGLLLTGLDHSVNSRRVTVLPTRLGWGRLLRDEGHHPRHKRRQCAGSDAFARLLEQLRRQPAQQSEQHKHVVQWRIMFVCFVEFCFLFHFSNESKPSGPCIQCSPFFHAQTSPVPSLKQLISQGSHNHLSRCRHALCWSKYDCPALCS